MALLAALLSSTVSTGARQPGGPPARPDRQPAQGLAGPLRATRAVAAVQRALSGSDTGRSRTTASSAPAHVPPSTVSSEDRKLPSRAREPEPRSARTVAGPPGIAHRLAGRGGAKLRLCPAFAPISSCGLCPPPQRREASPWFASAARRRPAPSSSHRSPRRNHRSLRAPRAKTAFDVARPDAPVPAPDAGRRAMPQTSRHASPRRCGRRGSVDRRCRGPAGRPEA